MTPIAMPNFKRIGAASAKLNAKIGPPRLLDPTVKEIPPPVRLIRGDAVILEPVRWLWPGYLPAGMLTILGGAPGCGKTTIALSLAATVTRGGIWPDGSRCTEPGDVLIWSGEDGNAVTAARLVAAGADMRRVHFIDGMEGRDGTAFDPGRDMLALETTAEALSSPRLLILDPIVSAVAGDSHKGAEVRRALQPVVTLGQRLSCAVLGITHFSKGTAGRDPIERVTGSIAFAALARLVLVAAKVKAEPDDDAEPRRVLMRAKSNIGPDDGGFAYTLERVEVASEVEGQRVRWLEALQGSARELLADAETDQEDDDGTTGASVDGFLRGLLADGPVSAKSIKGDADGAGYAWRTVQRSAGRIGVERRKEGMKAGWVWALGSEQPYRRRHEGAVDATQNGLAPSAPSVSIVAPSADVEVL
jgi:putative DNA primase/helicase